MVQGLSHRISHLQQIDIGIIPTNVGLIGKHRRTSDGYTSGPTYLNQTLNDLCDVRRVLWGWRLLLRSLISGQPLNSGQSIISGLEIKYFSMSAKLFWHFCNLVVGWTFLTFCPTHTYIHVYSCYLPNMVLDDLLPWMKKWMKKWQWQFIYAKKYALGYVYYFTGLYI